MICTIYQKLEKILSGSLLNQFGFKLAFETDKLIQGWNLCRKKCYIYEGMFKLNINRNKVSYAYITMLYLWPNPLDFVNFKRMHDKVKLDLIPYII